MPTLFALSGSPRADSTNALLLRQLARLAPDSVAVQFYEGLGDLPLFSPERDGETPPAPVAALRRRLAEADGVLLCTPEYAFGLPGALKNALDWTVGSGEFSGKPVALITASSLGDRGHQALLWVFEALGANVVASLLIPNVRTKVSASGITDPATQRAAGEVLDALVAAVSGVIPTRAGQ
jgi:NAD(P)H-dependent FMN reductase